MKIFNDMVRQHQKEKAAYCWDMERAESMMDHSITSFYRKLSVQEKTAFLAALLAGLATHLHIFSINFIFHDSTTIDGLGTTYASGRWLLGLFEDLSVYFLGVYQLPYFNGIVCLLMLGALAMLLVSAFQVESPVCAAYVGIVLVTFPAVASLFAFMYTAPAYTLSLLLAAGSVLVLYRKGSILRFAAGAGLLCLSLGIYQAYLPFAASLALLLLLQEGMQTEITPMQLLKKGLLFLGMLIAGLFLYYGVNALLLRIKGVEILAYQGLNTMGRLELRRLPFQILQAYQAQLSGIWVGVISRPFEQRLIQTANLLTLLLFALCLQKKKAIPGKKLMLAAMFALLPLAYNSIYIMVPYGSGGIHALMRYTQVFTFLIPAIYISKTSEKDRKAVKRHWQRGLSLACAVVLWLTPMTFVYGSNAAYLNAELFQEQLTAYYSSMVTRIRSTEGYRDELPVCFVGYRIEDESLKALPTTGRIHNYILGFSLEEAISTNHMFLDYCARHLGWGPTVMKELPEQVDPDLIRAMPRYPDDGSIRVVDEVIVVKLDDLPDEAT